METHLEDEAVEVADGLDDAPRAEVPLDLEGAGEDEVDDNGIGEVLPVGAASGGERERSSPCAHYELVHRGR